MKKKTKLQKINEEILSLQARISELHKLRKIELENRIIKCVACKKGTQAKKYPVIDVQYYKDEAYNEHWDHSRYYIICPKCKAELRIDNESLMKDYNLGKVFESCDKYEEKLQEAKNWIDNYDYEMMSERDKLKELMKSLPKSPKRKKTHSIGL